MKTSFSEAIRQAADKGLPPIIVLVIIPFLGLLVGIVAVANWLRRLGRP